jgi:hypothetical protein
MDEPNRKFSFSVLTPKSDTVKALLEWITDHKVKSSAVFSVSKQAMTESARELKLEEVCLTSFSESIEENFSSINLSMVGRKVTIDGITVDLSQNR